jgi:hypothetical protein
VVGGSEGRAADRTQPFGPPVQACRSARLRTRPPPVRARGAWRAPSLRGAPRRPPRVGRPPRRPGPVRLEGPQRRHPHPGAVPPRARARRGQREPDERAPVAEQHRPPRACRVTKRGRRPAYRDTRQHPPDLRDRVLRRAPARRDARPALGRRQPCQGRHHRSAFVGRHGGRDHSQVSERNAHCSAHGNASRRACHAEGHHRPQRHRLRVRPPRQQAVHAGERQDAGKQGMGRPPTNSGPRRSSSRSWRSSCAPAATRSSR